MTGHQSSNAAGAAASSTTMIPPPTKTTSSSSQWSMKKHFHHNTKKKISSSSSSCLSSSCSSSMSFLNCYRGRRPSEERTTLVAALRTLRGGSSAAIAATSSAASSSGFKMIVGRIVTSMPQQEAIRLAMTGIIALFKSTIAGTAPISTSTSSEQQSDERVEDKQVSVSVAEVDDNEADSDTGIIERFGRILGTIGMKMIPSRVRESALVEDMIDSWTERREQYQGILQKKSAADDHSGAVSSSSSNIGNWISKGGELLFRPKRILNLVVISCIVSEIISTTNDVIWPHVAPIIEDRTHDVRMWWKRGRGRCGLFNLSTWKIQHPKVLLKAWDKQFSPKIQLAMGTTVGLILSPSIWLLMTASTGKVLGVTYVVSELNHPIGENVEMIVTNNIGPFFGQIWCHIDNTLENVRSVGRTIFIKQPIRFLSTLKDMTTTMTTNGGSSSKGVVVMPTKSIKGTDMNYQDNSNDSEHDSENAIITTNPILKRIPRGIIRGFTGGMLLGWAACA